MEERNKKGRQKEKENSEDAVQSEFNEPLKNLSIDEADVESVNTCNDFWMEELSDGGEAR